MENNPVMQRVAMLTEQWKEAVASHKETRVFAWVGSSSIDYRMIKGFVLFHTSEESNLDDVFFSLNQPFVHHDDAPYGTGVIREMSGFIGAWNADKDIVAKTGKINWTATVRKGDESDEAYFIQNINSMADALAVTGSGDVLALALLPQAVSDYARFAQWINKVIEAGVSEKVRIMLFDTYDLKAFATVEKEYSSAFQFLYPDLDMPGAMGQILENSKSKKQSQEEKDAISFQQSLIKMNEAISYASKRNMMVYRDECLQLAGKHNWLHLEALVYFFVHSFYVSQKQSDAALQIIDKAIWKADLAVEQKIVASDGIKYQYRIAKGNLLFMDKRYQEASEVYKQCLQLKRDDIDYHVLLGVYQMLGNSLKKNDQKAAWLYFDEGWQLLKDMDVDSLKTNTIIMFYAKDMVYAAFGAGINIHGLLNQMNDWWGKDWLHQINKAEYNPVIN